MLYVLHVPRHLRQAGTHLPWLQGASVVAVEVKFLQSEEKKMRLQRIVVDLELKDGQVPYKLVEEKGGGWKYDALRHFFEDIDYKVMHLSTEADD